MNNPRMRAASERLKRRTHVLAVAYVDGEKFEAWVPRNSVEPIALDDWKSIKPDGLESG